MYNNDNNLYLYSNENKITKCFTDIKTENTQIKVQSNQEIDDE